MHLLNHHWPSSTNDMSFPGYYCISALCHNCSSTLRMACCCDRKSRAACAQLRTVAASNNRDHPTRSLSSSPLAGTINCSPGSQALLEVTHQDHSIGDHSIIACSRHIHVFLFFAHIPFVVNHTINATPPERSQQYQ